MNLPEGISIVNYEEKYRDAFRSLNVEWISRYFIMEQADYNALDHPNEYILEKGGKILVAMVNSEPVGVVALLKMQDDGYDFEMAKMAVSPKAQGKGIGLALGQAAIKAAKEAGATNLYLESNTILEPAISLYYKLGFTRLSGRMTPYKRCNIQMELDLEKS